MLICFAKNYENVDILFFSSNKTLFLKTKFFIDINVEINAWIHYFSNFCVRLLYVALVNFCSSDKIFNTLHILGSSVTDMF